MTKGDRASGGHALASSLPSKEQSNFKHLMMFFENKQYKKALRMAEGILRKHPDHGETLAMKSLTVSYLGGSDGKQEAIALAKKGLQNDFRSYLCWHVLGILYKSDKDFKEALKCFTQAAKLFPQNMMILRDLSALQIHQRMYEGFRESRGKMLSHQAKYLKEWTAFALANHLCEERETAVDLLNEVSKQFKDAKEMDPMMRSEMFLYKVSIMEECNDYLQCYKELKSSSSVIVDRINYLEMFGRIALILNKKEEAEKAYEELVQINQEHEGYLLGLLCCSSDDQISSLFIPPHPSEASIPSTPSSVHCVYLHSNCLNFTGSGKNGWFQKPSAAITNKRDRYFVELYETIEKQNDMKRSRYKPHPIFLLSKAPTEEQQNHILETFDELLRKYPKSIVIQRLCLSLLSGKLFEQRLDMYLRKALRKGIPSIFVLIRRFYTKERLPIIEKLLHGYVNTLSSSNPSMGGTEELLNGHSIEADESPVCLLYAMKLLAQHYSFIGCTELSIQTIDKAIEHSPTYIDLYIVKAKTMKLSGNYLDASKYYEEARQLDLADRFLNTKSAKYLFRANLIDEGINVGTIFNHDSESEENLHRTQNIWYDVALGECYYRNKRYGEALKQHHVVLNHFHDMRDDQMDLHLHCIMKATYRVYVSFLRMQDTLLSHKYYQAAAKRIIGINLQLYDGTLNKREVHNPQGEVITSASIQKQMRTKQTNTNMKPLEGGPLTTADKYLLVSDPLEEASIVLKEMRPCCMFDVSFYKLQYEVAMRKGKVLLMLTSLMRIWKLRNETLFDDKLIPLLCHFIHKTALDELPEVVQSTVREAFKVLFKGYYEDNKTLTSTELKHISSTVLRQFVKFTAENMSQTKCIRAVLIAKQYCNEVVTTDFVLIERLIADASMKRPLREFEKLADCLKCHASLEHILKDYQGIVKQHYPHANII